MTDRVIYLTVALDREYRTDDVQSIVQTIEGVRGVSKVELGEPMGGNDYFVKGLERQKLILDLIELLNKKDGAS